MMIVDGKALAAQVEERLTGVVSRMTRAPVLAIIVVGDDPVTASFVRIKKRVAERIGITIEERKFPLSVTERELTDCIDALAQTTSVDGIVVQLPLPPHIDSDLICGHISQDKDPDVLSRNAMAMYARGESSVLPPVAAAVQYILEVAEVRVQGREVLVLGHGRLVGAPVALLLRHNAAHVTVIDRPVADLLVHTREAEIIVSGVGSPRLITPDMVREGSVIIDAGTSETGGKIVGDVDPSVAEIAHVFTPVPGGVGPLAVVMLFKNLCILTMRKGPVGERASSLE